MTFLLAALIAIALVALLLGVSALAERISVRRTIREMATFRCPNCSRSIGLKAVWDGRDCSPLEELWVLKGELVHCYPVCRAVTCGQCGHTFTIRLNRDGEQFGRRLSVDDTDQVPHKEAISPERIGEMKAWIVTQRQGRTRRCT